MPKLHTSDLLEKFCSNEKHVYMKSVVLCAEFIAVVVYRKEVGRRGGGRREEEKRWWKKGRGELSTGLP